VAVLIVADVVAPDGDGEADRDDEAEPDGEAAVDDEAEPVGEGSVDDAELVVEGSVDDVGVVDDEAELVGEEEAELDSVGSALGLAVGE
jgi:hypothetical protein